MSSDAAPTGTVPADEGTVAVVTVRYFAAAREAAGTGRETRSGRRVGDVLNLAAAQHGGHFADVLGTSKVWVNGDPAGLDVVLADGDEVAVLPPVSGGCGR